MHLAPISLSSGMETPAKTIYGLEGFGLGVFFMLIGYARVSTEDQNLELQRHALKEAGCERIYEEHKSGANDKRPQFQAMKRHLRKGDVLVVWKLDRLGRNLKDLIFLADELREKEVDLKVITQAIDTTTAFGRFLYGFFSLLAQWERETTVERTKAGLEVARRAGKLIGRKRLVTNDVKQRALELVMTDAAKTAKELRDLLGIEKPTFYSNFPGGFAALRREAAKMKRRTK